MSDLHWNLRGQLKEFRKDGRLFVLLSIYLHKNTRNRAWPSNDLIADETGLSRAPISQSIKWLVDNHALMLVPYDKRIGDEKKLPNRKNIYQLTGVIKLNGKFRPYLYLSPEGWAGVIQELKDLGDSLISELLLTDDSLQIERLHSEHSIGEPKGITVLDSEGSKDIKFIAGDKRQRQADPQFDLIAKLWNTSAGGFISCLQGMIFDSKKVKGQWEKCKISPPATLEELTAFEAYAKSRMPPDGKEKMPTAAVTIQRYFVDFRNERAKPKPTPRPAAIIEDAPPATPEERAALLAAMAEIRPEWEKEKEKVSA